MATTTSELAPSNSSAYPNRLHLTTVPMNGIRDTDLWFRSAKQQQEQEGLGDVEMVRNIRSYLDINLKDYLPSTATVLSLEKDYFRVVYPHIEAIYEYIDEHQTWSYTNPPDLAAQAQESRALLHRANRRSHIPVPEYFLDRLVQRATERCLNERETTSMANSDTWFLWISNLRSLKPRIPQMRNERMLQENKVVTKNIAEPRTQHTTRQIPDAKRWCSHHQLASHNDDQCYFLHPELRPNRSDTTMRKPETALLAKYFRADYD